MSLHFGPTATSDNVVLNLDASNVKSFPAGNLPIQGSSLIGWYDGADDSVFNYSSGTAVSLWRDKSSYGNHATMSNGPTRSVTQNSKSGLAFNGSSQWGNAVTGGAISQTTMIAVCSLATLTPSGNNSGGGVVCVNQHSADNFNAIVYNEYTAKRWMNGSSGWARTPNTVSTSDETSTGPHIISNSIKTGAFNLYRNGTNLTSASYTYSAQTNGKIVIGNRHTTASNSPVSNGYWYGNIYEVIVYDRALTAAELGQVHTYLSNKWGISVSDGTWSDTSGNGYKGIIDSPTYSTDNKGILNFDGTDDEVDFGNVAAFSNAESFSVEVWFKYEGFGGGYFPIISKEGSSQFGYGLKIDGSVTGAPLVYAIATGSGGVNRYQYASPTLSSSNWYHVCATFNASAGYITLYLNGSQNHGAYANQGSFSGAQTSNNLEIGTNHASAYFNGKVAGAKIYSNVLTATEVLKNYQALKSRFSN